MIEASITKRLGKRFTLDVEFATKDGSLGILGPSGCGKSMTLKCIAGIETPDRGRIAVNGRTLFDSERRINVRPQDRRVGYLFQDYALFPKMTVTQNIAAGIRAGGSERERIIADLLREFHLEGMEKRYPDQLSGGQQQRAAMARMLAASPEVILLDEPFSALDSHLREKMQLRFLDIMKSHRDVVMVTHNRDEAYKLCSEMLVLDDGRKIGHGRTRDLFDHPRDVRIARLTGCKNFSRLEKTGERTMRAIDWGMDLEAPTPVPESARFVGIRAHDIMPVYRIEEGMTNLVRPRIIEKTEDPFEWLTVFTNADNAAVSEREEIWWKYSKYLHHEQPPYLRFPPEALLLLDAAEEERDE